ncbi:class I SAM-dependent methyltransferase [Bacillus cereus]|nr:class I SAM-dependent methyltransferase [Bacillus cereus]
MRLGNDLAAGFYPTPLTEGNHLIQLLQMESERAYACFDPCCGEGTILRSFADAVKQVGIQLDTYGVELDANRYNKAKEQLDVVIRSSFESMMISHDYFPLIFLNPPYNTELRTEKKKSEKMEFNFLKRAHHYLQDGGIMVYIIPYDRFARDEISYFLAKNYEEIGLMRFGDENEEFEQFKQCVFIGRKRAATKNDTYFNDRFANFCENMSELDFVKEHVNTLAEMVNRKSWVIPELRHQNKLIFTSRVDYKDAYEGVGKSEGILTFKKRLNRGNGYSLQAEKTAAERAKMPIASGQLGLLLITGVADGLLGEGDTLHAVRGSENVFFETSFEKLEKTTKEVVLQKRRAKFIIATPTGEVKELV